MTLMGRRAERGMLDELVEAIRVGESRAVVVSGAAGVGKTALLEYVVEQAVDCRLLRATGVQSEMELAFAALQQLCSPILSNLDPAWPGGIFSPVLVSLSTQRLTL